MTGWTQAAMEKRLVRYDDLVPCKNAFVDTRTPGSNAKENFTIIGSGVSENPNQHVHVPEPHGFNIGAARQPAGCLNSQHSHETAEVFVVHTGKWRFLFGPNADEGYVDLDPGDVISIPIHIFRGFEKRDEGVGFLFAVLGRDDPGKVTWAPSVFELADQHGLKLLKGGRLIDTTDGETVPEGAQLESPPSEDMLKLLSTPPESKLMQGVVRYADMTPNPGSPIASAGVEEMPIIVPQRTGDGFAPGPIIGWWPHGFNLRLLRIEPAAGTEPHARREEEALFVQTGDLHVVWDGGELVMGPGDTLTVPVGLVRILRAGEEGAEAYVVRGGDAPSMPEFAHAEAAE